MNRRLSIAALLWGLCGCTSRGASTAPASARLDADRSAAAGDAQPARPASCAKDAASCAEVLYDRSPRATIVSVVVDATHLYWIESLLAEGTHVVMAPKDGRGPVRQIAPYGGIDRASLAMIRDDTHVYVREGERLHKFPLGGGPVETTALPASNAFGLLLDGGTEVLAWSQPCHRLARVPKSGGSVTEVVVHDRPFAGGITGAAIDAAFSHCGNGAFIYVVDRKTGAAREPLALPTGRTAGALEAFEGDLFHAEQASALGTATERLTVRRKGATRFEPLGDMLAPAQRLLPDPQRRQLYWVTGAGRDHRVGVYDAAAGRLRTLAEHQERFGGSDADEDYVYWQGEKAIYRLRKP